jgi:histidine triad (HIT) family protein
MKKGKIQMDNDCIFCKIISGEVKANIIYEDEVLVVFEDIHPVAPVHFLIVPKKHIPSVNHIEEEDAQILAKLFFVARDQAKKAGIAESGFRLMVNSGKDGKQTVFHLHMHLIGGRELMGRLVN